MKNRIISFVLTLVMLFSCLSLDIFAAGYADTESTTGLDSEKTSASNSQKATYNSVEQIIADYFEKYGTIGKSGGYNLTAAQLAAKVAESDIIINTDFPTAATKYNNGKDSNWKYDGLNFYNDVGFERIKPTEKDGNYYLQWHHTPIATRSDGSFFDNFEKNEDGTYVDGELQTLVDKVFIEKGTVYYTTNSGLNDDYISISAPTGKITANNVATHTKKGATYTVTFDLAQLTPGRETSLLFRSYSNTKQDFASSYITLGVKILENGTLRVYSGSDSGSYTDTSFKFEDGEWAQISICHTPATNQVFYYVNGKLVATVSAVTKNTSVWTATLADGSTITIDPKADFTLYNIRMGQYGYGALLDDIRVYWAENVEVASAAHKNLAYSHKHDLANNKLILVATCQDEGCDASETLQIDLCDTQGAYGLSVTEIEDLLEQMGVKANVCCDFTDGAHGSLKFSNGTYKEDNKSVIDWYMIADRTDVDGNGYLLWQRPVAKNPKTNAPFTEAEVEALSETAKALIIFEDGVPYYTGKLTGEYVQYSFGEGDDEALKELIKNDSNDPAIGGSYAVTMDFTYFGGSFPFQILSNTLFKDDTPFSSVSLYPFKISDGKLNVYSQGKTVEVSDVTIPVGQTIQITFLHTPRGFDGERDVVDGYSVDDDNTFHIFIDGKLVVTSKLLPSTSSYMEWESTVDGVDVKVSPASDFTVNFARMGQINSSQANSTDLFAVDNIKVYRGEFLECSHSVKVGSNTCDWCHHEFDVRKCNLCKGSLLSNDVVFVNQSASLGEMIEFNAYLKLEKDPALFGDETIILDTTASGGTKKVECKISDLVAIQSGEAKGLYKVSIPLRSIDMVREITLSLSSENSASYKFSLNSYLDKLLDTNQAYYVRQLVKAMKNYGAHAQIYFEGKNGNPDDLGDLPNANLSAFDKDLISSVNESTFAPYEVSITGDSVEIDYSTFVLSSATELRIFFRDDGNVTVREDGKTLPKHSSDDVGYSYISLVNYSPASFGDEHTIVFSNGGNETTVTVSVYAILRNMYMIDNVETKNLASSMYLLGKSAYEYRNYYVLGNEPSKPDWDADGVLKLLCIGNSFSVDAMEWIAEIALDLGYTDIVFGNLYIGGCYIDKHIQMLEENSASYTYYLETATATSSPKKTTYRNYTAADAIISENWDFISLQQGSARSYAKEHYKNLPVLIDYVKTMCPSARLVWHQTWAYAEWYANEKYFITQDVMYKGIVDCVENSVMTNDEIEILIPSGTAIQNARTSYLGDNMNRDGTHLDYGIGRYIAALTFFAALTGEDISKVEWAPTNISSDVADVDADARAVAIESVINALKNPFEVTKSQYTSGDAPVDMTEYYDIIIEIANAYDRQGGQIPYDQLNARRSIYASPEDATAQRTIYLDCSSFVNSCYREGFGANVLPFEPSEVSCSTLHYDNYAKENNGKADDVIGYWRAQECEDKAAVADWIEDNLKIGDILTYRHGKTEGTKGHTYIYLGGGVFMHCAGAGSYTVNTSNPALSHDSNASETNGTIGTITFDKIFRSETGSRYIFKATESDTVYSFGIIRPFARGLTPTDESLARMKIAGLSMEKTASVCENSAVYGGSLLTYIFTLENTGNALSGVTISDILPKGTVFVSGDAGVTVENGKISWTGDVAQKSTVTVSYTVMITENTAGALIVSNESYVSGVKLGNIVHTVSALSEEKLAILAQTGIDFATEEREFVSALDMIKTIYLNHGIDLFEYSTADEILDLLIDLENLTCYKDSELSDILAPNMYGGLSVRYGWLYFEAENDKVRLPKEENLFIGDIIVADWSGGEAFYLYVGNHTLLTVEGGVCKALTIGDDIFTPGDNIIISLLGYDRYAVLRPTMRNIDMSDITSISVTKLPDKLTYFVDEQFDATGMEVTAALENGSKKVLSYYEISPAIVTADTKIITVKVGDLTATFEISVSNEKFVYDDISKVLELDVNEVILVEGFVVGVAHEGKSNDTELLIKDVNDDDIIAVRGMSGSYNSLYGYKIGDRIRFSATVKKDKSTSTSYKLKKYLEYSADNGAIADTIISTGNKVSYDLNNVVEIDSWDDMQNFFKEDSNNTSAYTAPYTYLKISGGFYVHFYAGTDTDNYRIHTNADATGAADIKPDAKRSVCIRDDVMNAILGSDWQELITDEDSAEYPGVFVEKDVYVLYVGGNNSYYQVVILDESWVSVSK